MDNDTIRETFYTKIRDLQKEMAALLADKRRLSDTVAAQVAEMAALRARVALLEKGLVAVDGLIGESREEMAALLGDVAPWEDLRTGGVYEEWLRDYDAALDAAKEG